MGAGKCLRAPSVSDILTTTQLRGGMRRVKCSLKPARGEGLSEKARRAPVRTAISSSGVVAQELKEGHSSVEPGLWLSASTALAPV